MSLPPPPPPGVVPPRTPPVLDDGRHAALHHRMGHTRGPYHYSAIRGPLWVSSTQPDIHTPDSLRTQACTQFLGGGGLDWKSDALSHAIVLAIP